MENKPNARKPVLWSLLAISILFFILTGFPNAAASENLAMVRMFEPDEAAPLPYVIKMITPTENLNQALRNFVFYQYYFYGFPFFSFSALALLPLRFMNQLDNFPLMLLILRQVVSVLPMLAALLLLVYLQDGFRTYRSPILYLFLLSIPAVISNSFWWHVDSLVFLLVMLVIYFLAKDDLRFGKHFYLAAAVTGCAAAAKLVGLYFFLAIAVLLLMGFFVKKIAFKKLVLASTLFIIILALSFLVSNPFLISHWARLEYQLIFTEQMELLSEGYGVVYEKGLVEALQVGRQYYGLLIFMLACLGLAMLAAIKGPNQRLHIILLAWFLPLTISVVWFTHFKYQYWLPVALPLFSSVFTLFPEKLELKKGLKKTSALSVLGGAALVIVLLQFGLNVSSAIPKYIERLKRAEYNPAIQFYDEALQALSGTSQGAKKVYHDYRLYVPVTPGWESETSFDLLSYNYIQQKDYDILLLQQQRILDYLDPEMTGINPQEFENSRKFYGDAQNGKLEGYQLIFRNEAGLVYIKEKR